MFDILAAVLGRMKSMGRAAALAVGIVASAACIYPAYAQVTPHFSVSSTSFAAGSSVTFTYSLSIEGYEGYEVELWDTWIFLDLRDDPNPEAGLYDGVFVPGDHVFSYQYTYDTPGAYFVSAWVEGEGMRLTDPSNQSTFLTWDEVFLVGDRGIQTLRLDVTAPIPEPETYAMLLAGLALLGFVHRKKRMTAAA